jgi:hypothetical protein
MLMLGCPPPTSGDARDGVEGRMVRWNGDTERVGREQSGAIVAQPDSLLDTVPDTLTVPTPPPAGGSIRLYQ